jgi:replicative DNA helicase
MQGLRVGIYEGEMTPDKVGYRIDTYIGNIKNASINRGDIYIQKEYKKYIDSLASRNLGPIKVFTPTDIPNGIVTVDTLRMFVEREKIDILFVDQYDLLDDTSYYNKSEPERVGNIAKAIKKLQVEKLIPIISVSQMNRTKNEDGSQDTTQVAGSDKIGRYATIMIALEQKLIEETKQVQLTLNIIKARDGGDHNKLTYDVNFNTGEFNFIPSNKDGVSSDDDFEAIENSYNVDFDEDGNIF